MVGNLKLVRLLSTLTLSLLLLVLPACIRYVPREEGTDTAGRQEESVTESVAPDIEDGKDTEPEQSTDDAIETDSKGFSNLPQDDQTKRY